MIKTTLILWAIINGAMTPAKLPMSDPETCEKTKAHFVSTGNFIHAECVVKEIKSKKDKQEE
jgi:hypothetical protein